MTKVIWFTGLSGSGKSTIANLFIKKLEVLEKSYSVFDGDDVRERLHKHLGFTPEDIKENNRLIIELCNEEYGKKDFIIVPVISPFRESRALARETFKKNFVEVFVNCSYEDCKKRDVKGLYKKAESGDLKNFIGLHVPYQAPDAPEVELNPEIQTAEESCQKLTKYLSL